MADAEFKRSLVDADRREDLDFAYPLDAGRTALLIIDLQYMSGSRSSGMGKKFAEDGLEELIRWRFDRIENTVIPNVQKLLSVFRKHDLPRVYLALGARKPDCADAPAHIRRALCLFDGRVGAPTARILDEVAPMDDEPVMTKVTLGAFASTGLDSFLRLRGVNHVLLTGISTSGCIDSTGRVAADLGYHSAIVADACSDLREEDHDWTLMNFSRLFGRVVLTDQALDELAHGLVSV